MELRRVQITRGGTFFVTLPKDWAGKNGLKRSSIVATSETADGRLLVDPRYDVERAPSTIIIKPSPHLEREVIGKYLLGYDIIRIEAKDRISLEEREKVKKTSGRLVGLEIIEEDHSKIVLQCLLERSALAPEIVLRREQSISLSMHKDAVTALIDGDVHLAKSVIDRDNEVDRSYFHLVRVLRTIIQNPSLSEKLTIYPIDCLDYRLAASLIESIGDQSSQIAEHSAQLGGLRVSEDFSEHLLRLHTLVYESHQESVISFLSRNVMMAESIREKREAFQEAYREVESAANSQPAEVAPHLLSVVSLTGRIYDHTIDISDLTMPKTIY